MNEKYELIKDPIINLYRIRALKDFSDIKAGTLGGYVENEDNLSHDGNAWIYGNARVYGDAKVCGDSKVYDDAKVYGNACVCSDAKVCGDACLKTNADYTVIHGFGSEERTTTFFRCKDGNIRVKCGCFYGTIDEFRYKVHKTRGDSKYAKEYLIIADLMKFHFSE